MMNPDIKRYNKNIDWIDGVKAFAIIAILLNHFVESFGPGPWFSNPSSDWPEFSVRMANLFPKDGPIAFRIIKFLGWLGDMGPGVFILLSGLTLTMSALGKPLKPFDFYRKRLLRIYPLYILIHLIILVVARTWFKWDIHFSIPTLLSLAGLRFKDSLFFFINPSWWFVWFIIQMYFLFPFLIILLKNKGARTFLFITFSVTILSRLAGILGFTYSGSLYFWMTGIFGGTRLFEFTSGMYLGYLLFNNKVSFTNLLFNKRKILIISFCIYVIGFICSWTCIGSLFSNIFITLGLSGIFYSIFEICFRQTNAVKSAFLWIGKNSFSVFLLHQPFMMYASPLLKGLKKGVVLIIIIVLSFIAGYIIEKLIALVTKTIKTKKENINSFLNGRLNRSLILVMVLFAVAASFAIMLGFSKFDSILKFLLAVLVVTIAITRINKIHATSFASRFFDIVLILSLLLFLITENWLSTYWILVVLSLLLLLITYKLRHSISVFLTTFLLLGCIFIVENYLRKNHPIEVAKWGEFRSLQMDSETVYSLIPNKLTHLKYNNYDYSVKTNSLGFNSPEINLSDKAANEKRVLIVGDAFSMPEGMEYQSSYPYLLEQKLREKYPDFKINVINAGVTGYGPNEEYAQLNKYIKTTKPDVVINQFFVNEFDDINILKEERRRSIGFFFDKSIKNRYFGNDQTPLQLNNFAKKELGIPDKQYTYDKSLLAFYKKDASFYDDTVINKLSKYFDRMKNLCAINHARYVVMYVPGQIEISRPKDIAYYPYFENLKDTAVFNFDQPQKIARSLCTSMGISYLNTTPYLKNFPVQPLYFPESWHWNKDGHQTIAKYLFAFLISDNLL